MAHKTRTGISGTDPKVLATIEKIERENNMPKSTLFNIAATYVFTSRKLIRELLGEPAAKASGLRGGGGNRTRELIGDLNQAAA